MARMRRDNSFGSGSGIPTAGEPPIPLFPHVQLSTPEFMGVKPPSTSTSNYTPSDTPRRGRSVFTSAQITHLEAYFNVNEYIDGERKQELSRLTNISEQQIKVWFQNRRQKKKREQEDHLQHH